jgi:hypothetical protein
MKKTIILSTILGLLLAALAIMFACARLVGCFVIMASAPLTVGLLIALIIVHRCEQKRLKADGVDLSATQWVWRGILAAMAAAVAAVLWITYVMVFDFDMTM